jgi:hypothetical protein
MLTTGWWPLDMGVGLTPHYFEATGFELLRVWLFPKLPVVQSAKDNLFALKKAQTLQYPCKWQQSEFWLLLTADSVPVRR